MYTPCEVYIFIEIITRNRNKRSILSIRIHQLHKKKCSVECLQRQLIDLLTGWPVLSVACLSLTIHLQFLIIPSFLSFPNFVECNASCFWSVSVPRLSQYQSVFQQLTSRYLNSIPAFSAFDKQLPTFQSNKKKREKKRKSYAFGLKRLADCWNSSPTHQNFH
jgi:hypothetical protein